MNHYIVHYYGNEELRFVLMTDGSTVSAAGVDEFETEAAWLAAGGLNASLEGGNLYPVARDDDSERPRNALDLLAAETMWGANQVAVYAEGPYETSLTDPEQVLAAVVAGAERGPIVVPPDWDPASGETP